MNRNDPTGAADYEARMQQLLMLDTSSAMTPDRRLLLAVLRQALLDFLGDDPVERLDAALYFARSPIYRATLHLFDLPDDLLPVGIDLNEFRREEHMDDDYSSDPLRLETLVYRLSGTQLKLVLSLRLMPSGATTQALSLRCDLTRGTVVTALEQLEMQELVIRHESKTKTTWSLPAAVRAALGQAWEDRENEIQEGD
jgi:hypothetical protein